MSTDGSDRLAATTGRLVQLTDLHLTATRRQRVWRADVWSNLDRVLEELPNRVGTFDRLLLTGDLANQRDPRTYHALCERLAPWLDQVRVLPGNHDNRQLLREAFPDHVLGDRNSVHFVDRVGGHRLLGLDSKWPKRIHGRLGRDQTDWLMGLLTTKPVDPSPTLLFVHHPPTRVGAWWLDKDRIRDRRALADVFENARIAGANLRALFTGHVHQATEAEWGGVPVHTTPATAYQFAPRAWLPRIASNQPAFRVIDLSPDRIETRIERLS